MPVVLMGEEHQRGGRSVSRMARSCGSASENTSAGVAQVNVVRPLGVSKIAK